MTTFNRKMFNVTIIKGIIGKERAKEGSKSVSKISKRNKCVA